MAPKLRVLSSKEAIKIFEGFGFVVHSQRGSHIKLRRVIGRNVQTLIILQRKEINRRTLRDIVSQAQAYISGKDLEEHFFND